MTQSVWQTEVADETAMEALGARLGLALHQGGIVYLQGDLGAGKTTLTRGLLHALGHAGKVRSPTYTLVEPYELSGKTLYHFDLYRLTDPEELELLGIRDYFANGFLLLVEWPSKGAPLLPPPDLQLDLSVPASGRTVAFTAVSAKGAAALAKLIS